MASLAHVGKSMGSMSLYKMTGFHVMARLLPRHSFTRTLTSCGHDGGLSKHDTERRSKLSQNVRLGSTAALQSWMLCYLNSQAHWPPGEVSAALVAVAHNPVAWRRAPLHAGGLVIGARTLRRAARCVMRHYASGAAQICLTMSSRAVLSGSGQQSPFTKLSGRGLSASLRWEPPVRTGVSAVPPACSGARHRRRPKG